MIILRIYIKASKRKDKENVKTHNGDFSGRICAKF